MNDITELKQFITVHAKAQDLPQELYESVLGQVSHDGQGPGSWVHEWSAAGERLERDDSQLLPAFLCHNMARFPFVDGPARRDADRARLAVFERWRQQQADIEAVHVTSDGGEFRAWASGLDTAAKKKLLVVMGGIVSTKEQWAPILLKAELLGMAMVVTELPGVGENTLPYDADSWRMLPALLDTVADRADVTRTYAVANSFSGHLALRTAVRDERLRGIVTTGAPVSDFFTNAEWQRQLPQITVATLVQLTGTEPKRLYDVLRTWALTDQELAALEIPVAYTVSLRDEIIPVGDIDVLKKHVRGLSLNEFDDVHASPAHVEETMRWTVESLIGMLAAATSA
ncbi:alpha/beta hydrolase [Streptomyces sp. NPDC052052]|uniref:alpha/beta fold hydrolase n=1 Tax=Streptomyces sp. NPDC052052 TaxID=3154756 RepID=UPI003413D2B9